MRNFNKETQLHILNNCPEAVRNGRCIWHHESVIFTVCRYLIALENIGFELFANLTGFKNLEYFFNGPRPDLVVKNGNNLSVIEPSNHQPAIKQIIIK